MLLLLLKRHVEMVFYTAFLYRLPVNRGAKFTTYMQLPGVLGF
jgi:hypothetical protein